MTGFLSLNPLDFRHHHFVDAVAFLPGIDVGFDFLVFAFVARGLALVACRQAQCTTEYFVALVDVGGLQILHRHLAGKLGLLFLHVDHAIPDRNAVAGAHVTHVFAIDGHPEAVYAGQSPVGTAGPMVCPRKARVRNQSAEACPSGVFLIAIERIQIADAIAENSDAVEAGVAQILFGTQFATDEIARSRHRGFVDQAFGRFFGNIEFCGFVHGYSLNAVI